MQRSLSLFLCVVVVLATFASVCHGQFNFSPNWGKRSGNGMVLHAGDNCEALQAMRVIDVYHACKVSLFLAHLNLFLYLKRCFIPWFWALLFLQRELDTMHECLRKSSWRERRTTSWIQRTKVFPICCQLLRAQRLRIISPYSSLQIFR